MYKRQGAEIPKNGKVILYTAEPDEEDYVEVPNFVDNDLESCEWLAAISGVQVVVTGDSNSGYAQSQNIASGTRVKRGSVVRISFVNSGGIETVTTE